MRPQPSEIPSYFERYIKLVKHENVLGAMVDTKNACLELIRSIDASLENYSYAEGKWTIKEVLIHCIDTERVFSTRALGFARGETQKALSYDENIYAAHCEALSRSLVDIAEEYDAVTSSTISLFKSFSAKQLSALGDMPAGNGSVNAIGFTIVGHTIHHLSVIKERYLK